MSLPWAIWECAVGFPVAASKPYSISVFRSRCARLTLNRVLGSTARRDHFLAHATPSAVASARNDDATLFEPAEETGARFSLIMDYWPGAAWTWLLLSRKGDSNWARLVAYNDV